MEFQGMIERFVVGKDQGRLVIAVDKSQLPVELIEKCGELVRIDIEIAQGELFPKTKNKKEKSDE